MFSYLEIAGLCVLGMAFIVIVLIALGSVSQSADRHIRE